jgi:MFS family permease
MQGNKGIGFVIGASSVGTLIEWYDFYIFGMLATIIAQQFFPQESGTAALLSTLAIFAAGFIVRPFGALVFGRLGDLVGRKYTFLLTLVLMGGSTFAIGLVPGFSSIGWWAPILVLLLRLVQGLALGGEYGGAATYVAEHAPPHRRGFYTSWIQTTATLGLFLALGVILLIRQWQGLERFSGEWGGWRYPFWLSALLVAVSVLIRMRMQESPLFAKAKAEGRTSANPIKESFGKKDNFKMVLLALFGAVMGQGVIWYTGQFYAQSFIENVCKVNFVQSRNILLIAILLATPGFILFGWLSDRVGRKWIMLLGMLLGVLLYRPIFATFVKDTNANVWMAKLEEGNPNKKMSFAEEDIILRADTLVQKDSTVLFVRNIKSRYKYMVNHFTNTWSDTAATKFGGGKAIWKKVSKPVYSDIELSPWLQIKFIFLVWVMIVLVTMVYGPIAAFLVELFPTKIRYTSMSLPYHIGNGVFGGLVPFLGTLMVEFTKTPDLPGGDPLAGLWYPIGVAALCLVIGTIYLPNKIDQDVMD